MKRRLRLKKEVKEMLIMGLVFCTILAIGLNLMADRADAIDSGEMIVISESEMDR